MPATVQWNGQVDTNPAIIKVVRVAVIPGTYGGISWRGGRDERRGSSRKDGDEGGELHIWAG